MGYILSGFGYVLMAFSAQIRWEREKRAETSAGRTGAARPLGYIPRRRSLAPTREVAQRDIDAERQRQAKAEEESRLVRARGVNSSDPRPLCFLHT